MIHRALGHLQDYLDDKQRELGEASSRARDLGLNHRQVALVQRAIEDPAVVFTAQSHASSHGITVQTARSDLSALEGIGVLESARRGRRVEWSASEAGLARLQLKS